MCPKKADNFKMHVKFLPVYILMSTLVPSIRAMSILTPDPSIQFVCSCDHNNDAGRWRDSESPSGRIAILCGSGGGCYQAEAGLMCVQGDLNQCGCAVAAATDWQSWHGDWFLWSAVTCSGLSITIT